MRPHRLFPLKPLEPTLWGRAGAVAIPLFFLLVAAGGGFASWALPRQDARAKAREARVTTAEGTIGGGEIRFARKARRRGSNYWEASVWYRFEVNGEAQRGSRLTFSQGDMRFSSRAEAAAFLAGYPEGRKVTVFYDREKPSDSALDPAWIPVAGFVPFTVAVTILSFVMALLTARQRWIEVAATPLPEQETGKLRRGSLWLASGVTLVASTLLAIDVGGRLLHVVRARRLMTVSAFVTMGPEVEYSPPAPRLFYLFHPADGSAMRQGSAWRFGRLDVVSEEAAAALVARLESELRGGGLKVFYDPDDPSRNAVSNAYGGMLGARVTPILAGLLAVSLPAALALRRRREPSHDR